MIGTTITISGTVNDSIVDGKGLRFTIFVQGCLFRCKGCHNPETHRLTGGYDVKIMDLIEEAKKNPLIDGITISGGEPFLQARECAMLAALAQRNGLTVWTYTGFTYEEIMARDDYDFMHLLIETDYLVDGRFIEEKKSYEARFRGSTNQRIIDVEKTLRCGKVVEWEESND